MNIDKLHENNMGDFEKMLTMLEYVNYKGLEHYTINLSI